jgi:hypothetical protein
MNNSVSGVYQPSESDYADLLKPLYAQQNNPVVTEEQKVNQPFNTTYPSLYPSTNTLQSTNNTFQSMYPATNTFGNAYLNNNTFGSMHPTTNTFQTIDPSTNTFGSMYPNTDEFNNFNPTPYNPEYQNYNPYPQYQNYTPNIYPQMYQNNSNDSFYPSAPTDLQPDDVVEFIQVQNTQTNESADNQNVSEKEPAYVRELNDFREHLLNLYFANSPQNLVSAPTLEEIEIAQPPVENKPVFVAPIIPKTTADSELQPLSYIDLAFPQIENANTYEQLCKMLPKRGLRDAVRHADRRSATIGKAEAIVHSHFKNQPVALWDETKKLHNEIKILVNQSNDQIIKEAEEVLELYYNEPIPTAEFYNKYDSFMSTFKGTHNFFKYVYEMAIAAKIEIESWDYHFAENNWRKETMIRLSINALERSLH